MRSTCDDRSSAPGWKRGHQAPSTHKRVFHVEVTEITPSEVPVNDTDEERIPLTIDNRLLLTPREAARRLSIGTTLCYRLLGSGDIPSILIGNARRIPVAALEAYVQSKLAKS